MLTPAAVGPSIELDRVRFRYEDAGEVTGVSVLQEVATPRRGPAFERLSSGEWETVFLRPEVDRFEYRFELSWPDFVQRLRDACGKYGGTTGHGPHPRTVAVSPLIEFVSGVPAA